MMGQNGLQRVSISSRNDNDSFFFFDSPLAVISITSCMVLHVRSL